jgi:hypothetical protein
MTDYPFVRIGGEHNRDAFIEYLRGIDPAALPDDAPWDVERLQALVPKLPRGWMKGVVDFQTERLAALEAAREVRQEFNAALEMHRPDGLSGEGRRAA